MTPLSTQSKCRTILFFIATVMTFLFMLPSCATSANKKKEEKKETPQYTVSGRDPKAFADAAAMFAPPSQKLLDDQTAKTILADLEMSFKEGDPWSPQSWVQLDRLRSVRVSAQLVEALRNTAQKMAVPDRAPSQSKAVAAKQAFEQGNGHYEAGRFDQAIKSYRVALKKHPAYWDAWNNMALAEMHSNNDLVALFVLSALTKNNPKYAGGSINLSVCLERLGQNAAAYDIAATVASKQARMPMAQYNMAWFENSRGKYESANTYLPKAMESISDYAVAKWLQTINSMESGRNITADELKALPQGDQSQGIPKIVSRPVKVAMADAYSGNAIVAKIPKDSQLVVSEKAGDWYAFYWPVDNVKHRLWTHQASLGSGSMTQASMPKSGAASLGVWIDPSTGARVTIKAVNGEPRAVSAVADDGEVYKVETSFWRDGSLTWQYLVSSTGYGVTFKTIEALSGSLKVFLVE